MAEASSAEQVEVGVVIVSGSCCIPGMTPVDERARQVVDQAIAETGVKARIGMLPVTTAMAGGIPPAVLSQLIGSFSKSGQVGLPAVLVDGKAVSLGLPAVEKVKAALLQAVRAKTETEGAT